jgi:ABC-type transport system involved in cytochrome c biogenesis permease subunit
MDPRVLSGILLYLLPFLYASLVLLYAFTFFRGVRAAGALTLPALVAVIAVHLTYLAARTVAFDHPPITSVFEIMSILAVSIAIAYSYIEIRTNVRTTGFFILLLACVFQTFSSLFIRDLLQIPDFLHSRVLGFHVAAALLGYTGISLSAVYGLLYLMLYHDIRASRFGIIYSRLPNLETLETMSIRSERLGFWALGLAILVGLFWLPRVFNDFSYWDPKLVATIAIWVLYAIGLAAKRRYGWQGRKMMIISLVAFCVVFFSMTVINIYLSGFHSFH